MEGNQKVVNLINKFAKKYDATAAQISLAWLLAQYEYIVPIPGTTKKSRIVENGNSSEIVMSNEDINSLTELLNQIEIVGTRF